MNLLNITKKDPAISPAGTSRTAPLAPEVAAANADLVNRYADSLFDAPAAEILDWLNDHAPGPVAVTMSMENTVLAELAYRHLPEADLLFLDTGYHFPETLSVKNQVAARYPQHVLTATPILSIAEQNEEYGPSLYLSNPTACCRMRKVEPLAASLSNYSAWVTGLRRADGPTRATAPALSLDATGRLKVSPLVTWSLADTEKFITDNQLITHPLTTQGYPSIGCATCTFPVEPGDDPRSGRWQGTTKTECGLHT